MFAVTKPTTKFELALFRQGYSRIAGLDEAGMGCWAGPVVAAAVILPKGARLPFVRDSKMMSEMQRERAAEAIKRVAIAWSVGVASPQEIDEINIRRADSLAMRRAIEGLGTQPDFLLVDAFSVRDCVIPQRGIIRGDAKVKCIAAASVIAKTHRDRLMAEWDEKFPGYGFARHKGYGTAMHSCALGKLGPCVIHRMSYEPVRLVMAGIGK